MKKGYLTTIYAVYGKQLRHVVMSLLFVFSLSNINSVYAQDSDGDGILDAIECDYIYCAETIVNGGFEDPVTASTTFVLVNESTVPGWETTAPDNLIEIWDSGFQGVAAVEGNQFVELNANVASTLFQELCIAPGSVINWSISHRGRSGVDVANVEIGATLGTTAVQQVMSDGNAAWGNYSGSYTVPAGQNTTVFALVTVSATGGASVGNFIDDFSITITSPPTCQDLDSDTYENRDDLDSDNDGILDSVEGNVDSDLDGTPDFLDNDSDNDGCPDALEAAGSYTFADVDANGRLTVAVDADGIPGGAAQATTANVTDNTVISVECDNDGDGIPPALDPDDDNDGIDDVDELNCAAVPINAADPNPTALGSYTAFQVTYSESGGNVGTYSGIPGLTGLEPFSGATATYDFSTPVTNLQYLIGDLNQKEWLHINFYDIDGNRIPDLTPYIISNVQNTSSFNVTSTVTHGLDIDVYGTVASTGTLDNHVELYLSIPITRIEVEFDALDARGAAPTGGTPDLYIRGACAATDTDEDGVVNSLDIDSDGDGILDSVEGNILTDADALPNYLDLDSDGDGIPDNVEAQTTTGYIGPNSDTPAIYAANNGLNSAYLGGLTPVNSDGADDPDYIDLDSDNEGANDTTEAGITLATTDGDNDGLDDNVDMSPTGYADPGGTIEDPLSGAVILPDVDNDAVSGGDVDFRDATDDSPDNDNDGVSDAADLDKDNDGIPDTDELNCIAGPIDAQDPNPTVTVPYGAFDVTYTASGAGNVNTYSGIPGLTGLEPFAGTTVTYDFSTPAANLKFLIGDLNQKEWLHVNFYDANGNRILDLTPYITTNVQNTSSFAISVTGIHGLDIDVFGTNASTGTLDNHLEFTFSSGISKIEIEFDALDARGNAPTGGTPDLYITSACASTDTDGDGVPNHLDLDSDGDGISDVIEAGGTDPDGDGQIGAGVITDADADGLEDSIDNIDSGSGAGEVTNGTPLPVPNTDGTFGPDYLDIDADGDGIVDNIEGQTTADYLAPSGIDTDNDGLDDNYDGDNGNTPGIDALGPNGAIVPTDTDSDGTNVPDYLDTDSDNDGDLDSLEGWDTNNDGTANTVPSNADADGDGLDNAYDTDDSVLDPTNGGTVPADFPDLDTPGGEPDWRQALDVDWDNDGVDDIADLDSDNDGIPDTVESGGNDPYGDEDGDGIVNWLDVVDDPGAGDGSTTDYADLDGNGIPDVYDTDGDGVPNHLDLDSDNDGIFDIVESGQLDAANNVFDTDNNGIIDAANAGTVGLNGLFDPLENGPESGVLTNLTADSDGDGTPDSNELDADNDGCFDVLEAGFADGDIPQNGLLGNGTFGAGLTVDVNGVVTSAVGYTEPDNLDGNANYDFQEAGLAVPTINTDPLSQTIIINSNVTFSTDILAQITYQWYESTDGGTTWSPIVNGGTSPAYSNATTDALTLTGVPVSYDGYMYQVILSSPAFVCDSNWTSAPATLDFFGDNDGDGIPDINDLDDDNDGIPDAIEGAGDIDGDGVPNQFDLDSDNDGIFDIVESGQLDAANNVFDVNNDGIIDAANAGTVGANGLYDTIETDDTAAATVVTPTADSDGDGTPDSNELDADDDGCFDVLEAGFTDGDAPQNGLLGNGTFGAGLTVNANGVVTSGVDGYTEPDNLDGNANYDFQEAGLAVPTINTDPLSQTIIINSNVTFSTDLLAQITYQWYESTDGGATWNPIVNGGTSPAYSNATTDALTLTGVPVSYEGYMYQVILSSPAFVCDSNWTSAPATLNLFPDNDGDGIPDNTDLDDDNDGIPDAIEGVLDTDGDGIFDQFDLDSDNDGIFDVVESGQLNGTTVVDANNDGILDGNPADFGANGLLDAIETDDTAGATVTIPTADSDGDGTPDSLELDADDDGCNDVTEAGYADADADAILGNSAGLTVDANGLVNTPGLTSGYTVPNDLDNNGVLDFQEAGIAVQPIATQPTDQVIVVNANANFSVDMQNTITYQWQMSTDGGANWTNISNGTGMVDVDPDISGATTDQLTLTMVPLVYNGYWYRVVLSSPAFACDTDVISDPALLTVYPDFDGDGRGDPIDLDDDNDGIPDLMEFEGLDPLADNDGDGVPAYLDDNDNNISVGDANDDVESDYDFDGDGIANHFDLDADGDGVWDVIEAGLGDLDADNDGIIDGAPADFGINGLFDTLETDDTLTADINYTPWNSDGDSQLNFLDIDDDGDGILTSEEKDVDADGDTHPNYLDLDADNDGIPDNVEAQTTADYTNPLGVDADGDGLDDAYGTGLIPVNTDGADSPDYLDNDSDNDNVPDSTEGHDYDADGEPDVSPSGNDDDGDGLDDAYDGSVGDFADPNGLSVGTDPATDLPNRDNDLEASINTAGLVTGDSEVDYRDIDDDGDGINTIDEDGDKDGDPTNDNCDEDAYPDYLDPTSCTIIPDGFSPNGDGDNDELIIPALAQFDNFEMEVYDRWGNIVYEYSNKGRAQPLWWDGYSSGTMTIGKGNKVPVGTYYYIIKYNEGGIDPIAGWVYVNY